MKTKIAMTMLVASAVWSQSGQPGWQEFSIGPPTRNQAGWPQNGVRAAGVPLKRAIAHAYGVPDNRVMGPDWLEETRYAITAIVADPKDFQPMFQKELANQFHMLAHRETKVVPVFVLKPLVTQAKLSSSAAAGTSTTSGSSEGHNAIHYPHATTLTFANALGDAASRPVIDETHLDGTYDFALNWKAGSVAALQAAVKDQLGLDLSDERRAVDLVMIDHIEKLQLSK
jgi:uncharacterized protein (TIGR03435 family)